MRTSEERAHFRNSVTGDDRLPAVRFSTSVASLSRSARATRLRDFLHCMVEPECEREVCAAVVDRFLAKPVMLLLALVCHPRRVCTLARRLAARLAAVDAADWADIDFEEPLMADRPALAPLAPFDPPLPSQ